VSPGLTDCVGIGGIKRGHLDPEREVGYQEEEEGASVLMVSWHDVLLSRGVWVC